MVQFGGIVSCVVVCGGLIFVLGILWLWVACLSDVYKRKFSDRTLWLVAFAASFFLSPLAMFLISIIYYSMFKPRLKFWE